MQETFVTQKNPHPYKDKSQYFNWHVLMEVYNLVR